MGNDLPILNLATAKYECTFGRGCDGVCCRDGHPLVYQEESERLDAARQKFWPLLRAPARATIEARGYLTNRRRLGQRMMRKSDGWCVFFNQGCVLHQIGAAEGDRFRYKPAVCSLFPIQRDENDDWYVRQKGFNRERWDLFCLDPTNTTTSAADSLDAEIALAAFFDAQTKGSPAGSPDLATAVVSLRMPKIVPLFDPAGGSTKLEALAIDDQ